jgi:hypothetical protein
MARNVCPSGWHLPSEAEWWALFKAAGSESKVVGKHLKAKSGWSNNGNGQDTYGFSALQSDKAFGGSASWHNAGDNNNECGMSAIMQSDDAGTNSIGGSDRFSSVRCVQGESQHSSPSTSYANAPQQPAASQPAEQGQGYGVRASIGLNSFSTGDSDADDRVDMGFGFGIGFLFKSISITPSLTFNPELHFFYRTLYNYSESEEGRYETNEYKSDVDEFAIGGSLLVQYAVPIAEMPFYITAGLQIDLPFYTETNYEMTLQGESDSGSHTVEDRRMFDFGLVLGAGYNVTEKIRADFRAVIGLTNLTGTNEDESSFNQYSLGVAYFF